MIELSVVIPNRNSPFTTQTIHDVLKNDARVHYIHPSSPVGLRVAVNTCVHMAKGKYILKTDDHCAFGPGFGKILIENHKENNWVQIPRRYALDAENWKIEERTDNKYPIDYMYIDFPRKGKDHDDGMHGVPWKGYSNANEYDIDDTPSMQGSCYFMTRDYFLNVFGGFHEDGYGQFAQESQELGFKTWLGGGALKVNKKTWYAHLHKGNRYGRFYKFPSGTVEASNWSAEHWLNDREPNMIHKFEWFIDVKFPGMPSWPIDWKEQIRSMGWTN
jgi:glycosyltransferase involved in cell wall biosynthesis